jgi:circadian clock protein KaiB
VGRQTDGISLRLFVAGDSPDCAAAIANLHALVPAAGETSVDIEIVDIDRDAAIAAREGIIVTPTLVKLSPPPRCRILGNLRNREALLQLLGLAPARARRD